MHSLLYILAKCPFFSVVTWKYIIKYLQKCEGCNHFCEILYIYYIYIRTCFSNISLFKSDINTHWPLYWVHLTSTRLDPPFAFRTALILCGIDLTRCWKHSSEILVHIYMIASRSYCRFVGCTSMMRISRSTTSQRCSIGLRSGDCGGHLSKVNSWSCSRDQSEMILCDMVALSHWK